MKRNRESFQLLFSQCSQVHTWAVVLWNQIILNASLYLKDKKSKEHIRQWFLHYFKIWHNASEAKRKIYQAIDKDAVSTKTACRWFERFRNEKFLLEDEQRPGHTIEIDLSEKKRVDRSKQLFSLRRTKLTTGWRNLITGDDKWWSLC